MGRSETLQQMAIKWRNDIKAGVKSDDDLRAWLLKYGSRFTLAERAVFKAIFRKGIKPRWHRWLSGKGVGK